jgi:hypothetical protein
LLVVDELFAGQIDYKEEKFIIEQTKFWPVYGRDPVRPRSQSSGSSTGTGAATAWNPLTEEWIPSTESTSQGDSSGFTEGQSDIPIFYPVPFREVSQIATFTLEEQRYRLAESLKLQYQRHYFIRRPGEKTIAAVTPFVNPCRIFPEREKAFILDRLIKPYALPVGEIDQELAARRERLLGARATAPEESDDPDDFYR